MESTKAVNKIDVIKNWSAYKVRTHSRIGIIMLITIRCWYVFCICIMWRLIKKNPSSFAMVPKKASSIVFILVLQCWPGMWRAYSSRGVRGAHKIWSIISILGFHATEKASGRAGFLGTGRWRWHKCAYWGTERGGRDQMADEDNTHAELIIT